MEHLNVNKWSNDAQCNTGTRFIRQTKISSLNQNLPDNHDNVSLTDVSSSFETKSPFINYYQTLPHNDGSVEKEQTKLRNISTYDQLVTDDQLFRALIDYATYYDIRTKTNRSSLV